MNYRDILIISDVDGTLLEKGFGVPSKNIEAVERFTARGGRFTVATDRNIESVGRFIEWIPLTAPAILLGGAVIYDYKAKRFLKRRAITGDWGELLKRVCAELPALSAEVYCEEFSYILRANDCAIRQHMAEHTSFSTTDMEFISSPVYKLRLCGCEADIQNAYTYLLSAFESELRFKNMSAQCINPQTVDVYPKNSNKRTAAAELSMLLGVSRENVAAVGDGADDISMLQYAGFSALIENSGDIAFGSTDIVVGACSKCGLAEFIDIVERHYGLK